MKIRCFILIVGVCMGVCMGAPRPNAPPPNSGKSYPIPPPIPYIREPPKPYAFDYGVKDEYSGANFGHSETSDGNAVQGSYSVALPDGRIQTVRYTADEYNGFQAEVTYEGTAVYPEYKPAPYPGGPGYPPPAYPAPIG